KFEKFEELSPRNAFLGGRTNTTKLKVDDGKKVKYIDICSLYPTVQCYDDYPVEHPTKIFKPPTYNSKWYGLMKCAIHQKNYIILYYQLKANINLTQKS
ncbi:hypothetical protein BDFB_011316, partial [Asbolus verrucosus]